MFSVAGWFKWNNFSNTVAGGAPAGTQYLVFKSNTQASCFEGYGLIKSSSDTVSFSITDEGTSGCTGATQGGAQSTSAVVEDAWHHIVGTFDGQNIRLYINGVLNDTSAHAF